MKGYIKDYRQELHSDIWMMPPLYHRVWQFLKYKVNHDVGKVPMRDGSFMTIQPGQHLTSMRKIATQVGYYEQGAWKEPNPKTVKSILSWLEKQGMISVKNGDGNSKYTLITLLNWEVYQDKGDGGNTQKNTTYPAEGINGNSNYTQEKPLHQSSEGINNEDGNSNYSVRTQSMDINKNDKECNKNDLFSSSSENDFAEVMNFYQQNLQKGISDTPYNYELINQWFDEWNKDVLLAAMKVAAKAEAKGVNFTEGVLKKWKDAGVETIEDARRYEKEFKANIKQYKNNVVQIPNYGGDDDGQGSEGDAKPSGEFGDVQLYK